MSKPKVEMIYVVSLVTNWEDDNIKQAYKYLADAEVYALCLNAQFDKVDVDNKKNYAIITKTKLVLD